MTRLTKRATLLLGCIVAALSLSTERCDAFSFSINQFTGGTSTISISVSQAGPNSVDFLLQVTNPVSPSASDISAFWGHVANEALVGSLEASDVKFNGVSNTSFIFLNDVNSINKVGNDNYNGGGNTLTPFDFGFSFGASGLDTPALNSVSFRLTNASGLSESNFVEQIFAARLQPLNTNDSSKLSGTSPRVPTVPDSGSTLTLLGLAVGGAGALRRYFGK